MLLSKKEKKCLAAALAVIMLCVATDKTFAAEPKTLNSFLVQQQEPAPGESYEVKTLKDRPKIKGCKKPTWYFFQEKVFELKCSDGRLFFIGRK